MATYNGSHNGGSGQTAPISESLRAVFKALPDEELVDALEATRWTGRPGYPVRVMWHTLVASVYLGIIHDTDLVRALHNNPILASACGIDSPECVPSKFAYCRFRAKLIGFNDLVARVLAHCVEALRGSLPNFGNVVAVDATDVKAWANGLHQYTDPDAGTGAKHKSSRRYYWYGYKVHLAVDANWELPVWFTVTPANVFDGHHLPSVLTEARERYDWFKPSHVLADKGYDTKECFRFVGEELGAIPVIDVQSRRVGRAKASQLCEAEPVITADGVRYLCERLPYDAACPRFGKCPLLPIFVDGPLNTLAPTTYYERYSPFPFGSKEWKASYNKRVSVERVFSRMKTYRKLDSIRTRRMPKVWLHMALSVLTTNIVAMVNALESQGALRKQFAVAA